MTIGVPGRFPGAYNLARYLAKRGELQLLVTTIPRRRIAFYGVPRDRTRCLSAFGYWFHGYERYGPSRLKPMNHFIHAILLDRAISRFLNDEDVFNGWSTVALSSMRRARRLGMRTVLTTGSTHIGWQTDELQREAKAWAISTPFTHDRLVQRSIEEYEQADIIVVPSTFAMHTFEERGIEPAKMRVVPWAVNPVCTPPAERNSAQETITILFVGHVSLRKGVPYLLLALSRIRAGVRLRLVGPVSPEVLALHGPLPANVDLVGRLRGEALAREYRAADIFVLPTIEDGSAVVVTEAMAAGLPVVVTDRAGAELVTDGDNGFVVPARDVEMLADRLDQLATDPALRGLMGHRAAGSAALRSWDMYGSEFRDAVTGENAAWPQVPIVGRS